MASRGLLEGFKELFFPSGGVVAAARRSGAMIFRFDPEDFEALAEAMAPVVERVVVRALGDRRSEPVEARSGREEVRYLTRKQVAMAFGISPRSVDRYEALGKIPRRRQVGLRTVRWLEHEVREAVLKMPKGAGEAPVSEVAAERKDRSARG